MNKPRRRPGPRPAPPQVAPRPDDSAVLRGLVGPLSEALDVRSAEDAEAVLARVSWTSGAKVAALLSVRRTRSASLVVLEAQVRVCGVTDVFATPVQLPTSPARLTREIAALLGRGSR